MRFNFYLTSFTACFLSLNSFAQKKQNVYFLRDNGRYVDNRDSADFTRVVQEPDSGSVLYNVIEYYPNGNLKMLGKSSAVDPVKLEGQNISYYPNKKKKRVCIYDNGQFAGDIYDYYPNGKMYRAATYVDNKTRSQGLRNLGKEEIIQSAYDSTGVETVKDGNGHYTVFDNDFKAVEEEGDVKDGKRNGLWKGTLNKGKVTYTEEYADGNFIKGTRNDENGSTINYTVKETLPGFNGGESAFGRFLSENIRYPDVGKQNNIQGRVILSFVVEKDGKITDLKVLRSVGPEFSTEAIRVLSQSPKWIPGKQHGAPVRVSYTMPINFALGR